MRHLGPGWVVLLAVSCAGEEVRDVPVETPAPPAEEPPLTRTDPGSRELSITLGESEQPFSSVDVVCDGGDRRHVLIEGGRVVFHDLPPDTCWLRFKGGGTPVMAPLPTRVGAVHCGFPGGEALCATVAPSAPSSGTTAPMVVRLSGPTPHFNSAQVECEGGFLQEKPWTGEPIVFDDVPDLDCRLVFHGRGQPSIVQHVRGGTTLRCSFEGRTPSCTEEDAGATAPG